jgi:hypothetical protein
MPWNISRLQSNLMSYRDYYLIRVNSFAHTPKSSASSLIGDLFIWFTGSIKIDPGAEQFDRRFCEDPNMVFFRIPGKVKIQTVITTQKFVKSKLSV